MDFQLWAAFVAASTALLVVPGPNVLLVVACTLGQGPRTALPLTLGVALGDLTAMTGSLLGLGALVVLEPRLFAVLRWAGALYLAVLGVSLWRRAAGELSSRAGSASNWRLMAQGWLSVMLNPLSFGFFVAFLPGFVDPARPFWPQVLLLEGTFVGLAFAVTLAYALGAERLGAAVAQPGFAAPLNRAGGAALVGTAAWLLVAAP